MQPIIQVNDLSKHFKVFKHYQGTWGAVRNLFSRSYETVRAVDEVSFSVQPGELVGYIGPNGAGKSTTIKMLTGLLVPSGGELLVNGYIPWKQRKPYVSRIGVVFGQRTTLWWDLPVIESLSLLQHIYTIPEDRFKANLKTFRNILGLDEFLNTPVRSLSLGQRMRADLCAAMLHDPDILFLDEPTIGLDVVAKEHIRQFIQNINAKMGTTVILTTHDLGDLQKLCQRVMIIDHGKLLYDGSLEKIAQKYGGKRQLIVYIGEDYDSVGIPDAEVISRKDRQVVYQFERSHISASKLIGKLSREFTLVDLEVREPEIEETIRRIYQNGLLN